MLRIERRLRASVWKMTPMSPLGPAGLSKRSFQEASSGFIMFLEILRACKAFRNYGGHDRPRLFRELLEVRSCEAMPPEKTGSSRFPSIGKLSRYIAVVCGSDIPLLERL